MLLRSQAIALLGLLALLSGCASTPRALSEAQPQNEPLVDHRQEIETLLAGDLGPINDKALDLMLKQITELEHSRHHQKAVPHEINARVRWWIYYYAVREHVLFQRMLDRGEAYRQMITGMLDEHLMPSELYHLAMIESGFVMLAESHANAAGIWQMIPSTGTSYGLHIDAYRDERIHPYLATEAALKHLQDLRHRFKNWYLVLAAYNAGPERISRAIRRGKTSDFWELARRHILPAETMDYIPKFMAAVIIASHYERFGFKKPNPPHGIYPEVVRVKVKPGMSLAQIARQGSIELSVLKHCNPQLKTPNVPMLASAAEIWVPATKAQALRVALLPKLRSKGRLSMAAVRKSRSSQTD